MAANANLVFDVATIKPSNPATPGQSLLVGRGGSNSVGSSEVMNGWH
jgi:hypothetical protein